ncbi:MAG: divergent polysaccharide deacetylase family protein [Gammaproteobacteria bacterium]
MTWRDLPGLMTLGVSGLLTFLPPALAAEPPVVAIIIDDMGNSRHYGLQAAALPGPVACSVLPHTPRARELAAACHREGKEVMLHLPMQAADPMEQPGPGVLTLRQDRAELLERLDAAVDAVPYASGMNNHMGSLLTRHLAQMQWLMSELSARRDWFFVDSFTTPGSVAWRVAIANGLPTARRDVFLDNSGEPADIRAEIERLKVEARQNGFAVAIGHPRATTLAALQEEIPRLQAEGIMLVSVEELIRRSSKEAAPWLVYSSPSPPGLRK